MRKLSIPGNLLFGLCLFYTALNAAVDARENITAAEYQQRRDQVTAMLDSQSVALLSSGTTKARAGDLNFPFYPDPNFYYLTGCKDAGAFLLLAPQGINIDGTAATQVLFLASGYNAYTGDLRGEVPVLHGPGAMVIADKKHFDDIRHQVLSRTSALYVPAWPQGFLHDPISDQRFFIEREAKKAITEKYPQIRIKPLSGRLAQMRQIKSEEEIVLLKQAATITSRALCEVMRSAEPGMYEYDLQAILEYVFKRLGAEDVGFNSIVGSGPNAIILHYDKNSRRTEAGELVVMDVGAQYEGYGADITRTFPVNGRFSPAQRDLYEIVLRANREAIQIMKPGVPFKDVEAKAAAVVADGLLRLGIIPEAKAVKKYLPHGVSHHIGLETHDAGEYKQLQAGMVITMEPGIYIPIESPDVDVKYRGIGIRIEDDILITPNGHEVITDEVPRTMAEIEKLMKEKGLGQIRIR